MKPRSTPTGYAASAKPDGGDAGRPVFARLVEHQPVGRIGLVEEIAERVALQSLQQFGLRGRGGGVAHGAQVAANSRITGRSFGRRNESAVPVARTEESRVAAVSLSVAIDCGQPRGRWHPLGGSHHDIASHLEHLLGQVIQHVM